jgi:Domain of unknown function (DUF4268)
VRIVLVSAEFSKEITTAVMWLNERSLDIRCVRIKPYRDNDRVLIDVQQVIPLPEAEEYQIQIRQKETKGREDRAERYGIRKRFWQGLLARAASKTTLHADISAGEYHWIGTSSGIRGLNYNYTIRQDEGVAELYIDRGEDVANKRVFDNLYSHRTGIEHVFGEPLSWERLDDKRACRIAFTTTVGGWRSDESQWSTVQDAMIDAMVRLEKALGRFWRR